MRDRGGENGKGEVRKEEGSVKMREGRRKVCLLLNGGLVTPLLLRCVQKKTPTHVFFYISVENVLICTKFSRYVCE